MCFSPPKGITISHAGFAEFVMWDLYMGLTLLNCYLLNLVTWVAKSKCKKYSEHLLIYSFINK